MGTKSVFSWLLPGLGATALTILGTPASVSAQSAAARRLDLSVAPTLLAQAAPGAQAGAPQAAPVTRRLTIEEAVKLALENNLGIQIARYDPQRDDYSIAQAQGAWVPTFQNTFQKNNQDSPNNSFLAG